MRNSIGYALVLLAGWTYAAPQPTDSDKIITACVTTAVIAKSVINGDMYAPGFALQVDNISEELSEPLPQIYNAIRTVLYEALIHHNSAHSDTKEKATTDERAAVLGTWCVNDAITAIHPRAGAAAIQDAETQRKLVNGFLESLAQQH